MVEPVRKQPRFITLVELQVLQVRDALLSPLVSLESKISTFQSCCEDLR